MELNWPSCGVISCIQIDWYKLAFQRIARYIDTFIPGAFLPNLLFFWLLTSRPTLDVLTSIRMSDQLEMFCKRKCYQLKKYSLKVEVPNYKRKIVPTRGDPSWSGKKGSSGRDIGNDLNWNCKYFSLWTFQLWFWQSILFLLKHPNNIRPMAKDSTGLI